MKRALDAVNEKIVAATKRRNPRIVVPTSLVQPRLIAVSKLQPISSIIEAYECGQRYFGENYIQELVTKSNSEEIVRKCPDIKFHFIGHLQSNKVNQLLRVKNLNMIETIDSMKLANLINKAIDKAQAGSNSSGDDSSSKPPCDFVEGKRLNVMIQVNTSDEDQKNGVHPDVAPQLAKHIFEECPRLNLSGIMTIGSLEEREKGEENTDFAELYRVRQNVAQRLSLDPEELELSMGMSGDFEEAIVMGSTNVRVGTMIFGARPPKPQTAS